MSLHRHVLFKKDSELKQAVKSFACFVRHAKKRDVEHMLPELIKHDAPRVLGDVFLAAAAAVFLDSSWTQLKITFTDILDAHLLKMIFTFFGTFCVISCHP